MSYFGKDFDHMMGWMLLFAVIGFVASVLGILFGVAWLIDHVRFV